MEKNRFSGKDINEAQIMEIKHYLHNGHHQVIQIIQQDLDTDLLVGMKMKLLLETE